MRAEITKAAIIKDKGTTLLAVAETENDAINIKVKYDFNNLDIVGFFKDLREKIAHDLEVPVSKVNIHKDLLEEKIVSHHLRELGLFV